MIRRSVLTVSILFFAFSGLWALQVPLGEVEIGLESYDGYQEGMAYFSTDESGMILEILIAYKGFGLDTVTWTFSEDDLPAVRDSASKAAWWRSRLLEMTVEQTVVRDIVELEPALIYAYRGTTFPFESSENVLRFVRQGRDYAMLLTEKIPGADTRRSGEKTLPVFTMHFPGKGLPELRDMLSEENMLMVIEAYAARKAEIEEILSDGPETTS